MAFSAYRMVYASIWDWRINHIPLNRAVPFSTEEAELSHAVFTHQVGWGTTAGGHFGNKNAVGDSGRLFNDGGAGYSGNGNGVGTTRKPVAGHVYGENIV